MDNYQRSLKNFFTTYAIDRVTEKRRDEAWLKAQLQDERTRFVPVWKLENLFTDGQVVKPVFLAPGDVQNCVVDSESTILLGVIDGRACFALGLPSTGPEPPSCLADLGQFQDLRQMAALLDATDAALMAYARAMTYWHCRHKFCGVCGSPTRSIESGFQRICTSDSCRYQHFPRTDPAIIVLVSCEHCALFGRKAFWPPGRYSTIAGFVEPGETLEAAVLREVEEETDIRVKEVHYHSSQPWPFPSSLMLGFSAVAGNSEIHMNDNELENARWLTREELKRNLLTGEMGLPPPISISFRLIEDWFNAGDAGRLRDLI
jgi:NAD+ diphosphatase